VSSVRLFPSTAASVTHARHYTLETLTGIRPELAGEIAVMVSELTTNSVRHAAADFSVAIDRTPETIRIAVTDNGPGRPEVRSPEPTEPSGRGLQIVRALSDDWGIAAHDDGHGKTVWFSVATRPEVAQPVG